MGTSGWGGGGEPWFIAFADFCGVNIPTEDNFKLPTLNRELERNVHPGLL